MGELAVEGGAVTAGAEIVIFVSLILSAFGAEEGRALVAVHA